MSAHILKHKDRTKLKILHSSEAGRSTLIYGNIHLPATATATATVIDWHDFKLVLCLETSASDSTEWKKKPGEKQPHLPGSWELPIGLDTQVQKSKVKTSKIKMHRVESARNGVWVIMEGLVRKRPTRNKRNNSRKEKSNLDLTSVSCIAWKIFLKTFSSRSYIYYYILGIIYWALTMWWLIAKHFI